MPNDEVRAEIARLRASNAELLAALDVDDSRDAVDGVARST